LSDAKARIAQALNGGEEDWYQSQFLPIKTRKGEWDWGVPGMIQAPWDAWKREYDSAWGIGPGVTQDQQIEDAMSIAGLMAGGGVGGVPKGALGTFGGRLAVTADKQALAKAEEMAAAGIPPDTTVWTQTGLGANTSQQVYVQGFNAFGTNNSVESTVLFTSAAAPSGTGFASVSVSSLTLSWSANGNSDSTLYEIALL
jgi:hypothetical protein